MLHALIFLTLVLSNEIHVNAYLRYLGANKKTMPVIAEIYP